MGADEHIDLAVFDGAENLLLLLGRAETAEHLDPRWGMPHAFGEGLVVLLGENGGGHQHGGLLVVADGLEGRTHGDFGLAIAYIAAD